MSTISVDPYIFFRGNCKEAMEFYKSIFGGELYVQTYGEVNSANKKIPTDYVMHASLHDGPVKIMASDTAEASEKAAKVSISLTGEDKSQLTKFFDGLSQDVEVKYPLKKEFWGDTFGSVTDKYGVEWMVNITAPKT